MTISKLNEALRIINTGSHLLENAKWDMKGLDNHLNSAHQEIEQIQNNAIEETIKHINHSYLREAQMWASKKTTIGGEKIPEDQIFETKTELEIIQRLIVDLGKILT